jgi:hypothetical protein
MAAHHFINRLDAEMQKWTIAKEKTEAGKDSSVARL